MGRIGSPKNDILESYSPVPQNMTLFGHGVFIEVKLDKQVGLILM